MSFDATSLDTRWFARRPSVIPAGVTSDDIRHYELSRATVRACVVGTGDRTLVIVPDPPNMIEHYAALLPRLAPRYRVVCFEAPGFGFSFPKRNFRFTHGVQAELVAELLDLLRVRAATFCAACIGAHVALRLAAERSDLVGRLVLSQAISYGEALKWTRREDVLGIINTPFVGQVALALGKRVVARQWYHAALPQSAQPSDRERYLRPTLQALNRGAGFPLASAFQTFLRDPRGPAPRVTQETVVLWGGADRTHELSDTKSILQEVPHASWIQFSECGHFPDLENPDEYVRLLTGDDGGSPRPASSAS